MEARLSSPAGRCGVSRASVVACVYLVIAVGGAQAQTVEEKAQLCAGCHGEAGIPTEKSLPGIDGQMQGYLYLQLRDYKLATRNNEIMAQVVAMLERDDMMALAEHFSQRPWPALRQPSAADEVAAIAKRTNTSVGCTSCHLDAYQGTGTVPRLAGQSRDYLANTMLDFRSGARGNNPGMSDLMKAISEKEIAAMADYLAGR